jgi:hypothetical protein
VLAVIVIIGMLNICLGFGLAMYCGYGPPGLNGIFQALGPMPPEKSDIGPPIASDPQTPAIAVASEAVPPPPLSASSDAASAPPDGPPAEESVLSEVQELTAAAQTAIASVTAQAGQE